MSRTYRWKRAVDLVRALGQQKQQAARDRWSRDHLMAFQREQVAALVAHATRHSALYRRLYGGELDPADVELAQLPVLDKATMMHGFDDLVTDPRLRRADLERHLAGLERDELYLGEYRVMASGGSSGQRGIYVYDRRAWSTLIGSALRWTRMIGFTARLPRRRGFAIGAPDAKHMTFRISTTLDVGLHRMQRARATSHSIDSSRDSRPINPSS
jgi:phenylacetate-CoA ligase